MSNGSVLIVGGQSAAGYTGAAELYDPASQTFTGAGALASPRSGYTATLLNDGTVLIAGGCAFDCPGELYAPTPPAPYSLEVTPASASMLVGESRQFTAVDNHGYPRSDVTWTLSDYSLATVTPDGATSLTATAAGNLTLTATVDGVTAQAQIAISPSGTVFPPGTVVWSAPPVPGFSPLQIAQAVPTDSGPDLYSVHLSTDGTQSVLQALTADGQLMWKSLLPTVNANSVPDGFGGLLVTEHNTCNPGQTEPMKIVDLDATTGQPLWEIAAAGIQVGSQIVYCYPAGAPPQIAIRGDGNLIVSEPTNAGLPPLMVVNGISGGMTTIPIPASSFTDPAGVVHDDYSLMGPPIVDSDGSAYVEYQVRQLAYPPRVTSAVIYLLKIGTDGFTTTTQLMSNAQLNTSQYPEPIDSSLMPGRIIPDGQGGVLATWTISPSNPPVPPQPWHYYQAAHVVSNSVVASYDLPFLPVKPVLNRYPTMVLGENGTAFVTDGADPDNGPQVVSFNLASGAVNWGYQASTGSALSIMAATSDDGIAINDSQAGVIQLGPTGSPSQISGVLGGVAQFSWGGNWYVQGLQGTSELSQISAVDSAAPWPTPNGSPSQNGGPGALCTCLLQTSDAGQGMATLEGPARGQSSTEIDTLGRNQLLTPDNCAICTLPSPPAPDATSCLTIAGSGPSYLILVGDPGLSGPPGHNHNVGDLFNLAAQQSANDLQGAGNKIIACRVSSVQNFNAALTKNGFIAGDVIYFGHSGLRGFGNPPVAYASLLFVGQASGDDTNIGAYNVSILCDVSLNCNINQFLSDHTAIRINGCQAGDTISDYYSHSKQTSIAQMLANQLRRGVYAQAEGMYFSHVDAAHDPYVDGRDPLNPNKSRYVSGNLPMYMVPEGTPGQKKPPLPFTPQ